MLRGLIILIGLFMSINFSTAQIKVWENLEEGKEILSEQWVVNDLVFSINSKSEFPFEEKAEAIVTDDSGTQMIPLFYNGDGDWILRYSSFQLGTKNFIIESSIDELNGITGEITINKNLKKDRHGSIVLNEETPNRFFYQDGQHYFNLAFECDWLFALDYGEKDLEKTKHLLKLLNHHGFNQIVMNVYSYDVSWPKDERLTDNPEHEYGGREDIFPFLGSNSNPDYSSLNIDFFKHFDSVISEMHNHEIVCHLMIYVWNKLVSWPEMESKEDNRYFDYVVKRYQAFPNMIWDVSKEALHRTRATKQYIVERIERIRRIGSYDRLVSVHDYGFCRNHPDLVDFISMQDWKHTLYQNMMTARNDFPKKPIFNIEHGGYEVSPYNVFPGAYTDAEVCLRRNYMCLFAGGYTTYYWQGASWNVLIHNPYELSEDFKKPHFEYFKYMREFMESVNFEHCESVYRYNSSGYNLTNYQDGIVLLYTPKENNWIGANAIVDREFEYENATRQWFNTLTGEYTEVQKYERIDLGFWDDRPWKGEADAILIIRNLEVKN